MTTEVAMLSPWEDMIISHTGRAMGDIGRLSLRSVRRAEQASEKMSYGRETLEGKTKGGTALMPVSEVESKGVWATRNSEK